MDNDFVQMPFVAASGGALRFKSESALPNSLSTDARFHRSHQRDTWARISSTIRKLNGNWKGGPTASSIICSGSDSGDSVVRAVGMFLPSKSRSLQLTNPGEWCLSLASHGLPLPTPCRSEAKREPGAPKWQLRGCPRNCKRRAVVIMVTGATQRREGRRPQ